MTRWGCPTCGTVYGQLLYAGCPRHPGTALVEEEHMPKSTVHSGASNADDPRPVELLGQPGPELATGGLIEGPPAFHLAAETGAEDAAPPIEDANGGEQPSAGTSSSTSAAKPRKNAATRKPASPSPAPTTENP